MSGRKLSGASVLQVPIMTFLVAPGALMLDAVAIPRGRRKIREMLTVMSIGFLCFSMFSELAPTVEAQSSEPSLLDVLNHFGYANVTLTSVETFPSGLYDVSLLAEFAANHTLNELDFYVVNTTMYNPIFFGPEGQYGYDNPPLLKNFSSAREFGMSLYNPQYRRFFTQEGMNTDGHAHARVYRNLGNLNMYLIGFEDSAVASDFDYNDMVVSLTRHGSTMSVYPDSLAISSGRNVTVAVKVTNVTALYDWQVVIKYNASVVSCSAVWIPNNNVFFGMPFVAVDPTVNAPSADGLNYALMSARRAPDSVVNVSSGTLFNMNFTAIGSGEATILIATKSSPIRSASSNTSLYSFLLDPDLNEMPFTAENGFISTYESVYVVVASPIFDDLAPYLSRYTADLMETGLTVKTFIFAGSSNELRSILRYGYQNGLKGCLLVGDIPIVWYEMKSEWHAGQEEYEKFPTDLFYMDLHGEWADTDGNGVYDRHTGNWSADIWVGRIKASGMAENEISLIRNYFDKDHNFRIGALSLPNSALTYVDDDWAGSGTEIDHAISFVYNNRTLVYDSTVTNPTDYLSRLAQNWNLVQVLVHGWSTGHQFKVNGEWDGYVYSSDIRNNDPHAFFYNLFSCSNAKYSDAEYIAGWYIFSHSYGLAAISSTKTGGMCYFDDFYREFRNNTLGESFLCWLNQRIIVEKTEPGFWYDSKWYYGMTIIGDPTLYSAYNSTISLKQSQPSIDHKLTSAGHDASLSSAVLRVASTKGLSQYSNIQEAIDAANPGDTIEVAPGIYEGHLTVNKPVTIVGQDPNSVLVVSNETGPIFLITADNVTLDSLTIKALPTGNLEIDQFPIQTGIAIYSDNNVVQNNNIVDCDIGIELSHVYGNALNNNQIKNASQSGINARYSAHGNVTGNVIENSLVGAYFLECQNTTFSNNVFSNSTYETIRYSSTDVSITRVKTLKTVLCQDYTMPIEVAVENQGNFSATFDVTLYANGTAIDTVPNVTLRSGDSTVLTFNWSAIDWPIGNYTVWVYIRPIQGELYTQNNMLADGTVYISITGDINMDDKVDMRDVAYVGSSFMSQPGDSRWNPNADINGDGKIDLRDVAIPAKHFGEHYPLLLAY